MFSPRGDDGRPRPLFDRTTGVIDREITKAWEAYDIRLVLERIHREMREAGDRKAGDRKAGDKK